MMQIVGKHCVICGQPITVHFEGVYCRECGLTYHRPCLKEDNLCDRCGRDIRRDLEELDASEKLDAERKHVPSWVAFAWLAPLIVACGVVLILLIAGAIYGTTYKIVGGGGLAHEVKAYVWARDIMGTVGLVGGGILALVYISGLLTAAVAIVQAIRLGRLRFLLHGVAGLLLSIGLAAICFVWFLWILSQNE